MNRLYLILAFALALQVQAQTTTIAYTLTNPDGSLFAGTATRSIDALRDCPSGGAFPRFSDTVSITGGSVSWSLRPNIGCKAVDGGRNAYKITFRSNKGASWTEWWGVPSSASPLTNQNVLLGGAPPFEPLTINSNQISTAGATSEAPCLRWNGSIVTWGECGSGTGGSVTWETLAGKPSVFPPDTHSHLGTEITSPVVSARVPIGQGLRDSGSAVRVEETVLTFYSSGANNPSGTCQVWEIYKQSTSGRLWHCIGNTWVEIPRMSDIIANAIPSTEKGAALGVAPLNASSRINVGYLGSGTPDGTKFLRDDGSFQPVTVSQPVGVTSASGTLDFGAIAAGRFSSALTFTATGYPSGTPVSVNQPLQGSGYIAFAWISAANTASVVLYNANTTNGDPASASFTVSTGTENASGTTLPATCRVGETFIDTDATAGSNFYACIAPNVWALQAGGGSGSGMADPMTTRGDMIYRNSGNTTARLPVGTGFLKANGTDVTGFTALTASDIGSGTFADARISQSSVTQHQAALSIPWSQLGDPAGDKTFNTALHKTYWIPSGTMASNTQYFWIGPQRAAMDATYMGDGFDFAPYGVSLLNQANQIVGWRVLNQQNTPNQYVLGGSFRVYANPSSGTTPLVSGAEGDAWCGATGTGSITFCNGLVAHVHNAGTQPVTNGMGVLIYEPTNPGGGGFAANYGLYIQNQRNAFTSLGFAIKTGTGIVDFSSADNILLPSVASPTLATNAEIIYDTAAHAIRARINGATRSLLHTGSSAGDFPTLNQNTTGTAAGLSSTLAVSSGGTGATTLTGLLQGNGTSAVTTVANSTTVGQVLRVTGSNAYGFGAVDLADGDAVTGTLPATNLPDNLRYQSVGATLIDATNEVCTVMGYAGTITAWRVIGNNASGSVSIEVWKDSYANAPATNADDITGTGTKPNTSSAQRAMGSTFTNWTSTSVARGDHVCFKAASLSGHTKVWVSLEITRN